MNSRTHKVVCTVIETGDSFTLHIGDQETCGRMAQHLSSNRTRKYEVRAR